MYGCTDSDLETNDPLATCDDGSCPPVFYGCMDFDAHNWRDLANKQRTSDDCLYAGCLDSTMLNYKSGSDVPGPCKPKLYGCTDSGAYNYNSEANIKHNCIYAGCTDSQSPSFDPTANEDDGTCAPRVPGCTDPRFVNYEPAYNVFQEGACSLGGCKDSTDSLYNALATFSDGSCANDRRRHLSLQTVGCVDPMASNVDISAAHDQSVCVYTVQGCMDSLAKNYHSAATNSSECVPFIRGCSIPRGTLNFDSHAEVLTDCVFAFPACTDSGVSCLARVVSHAHAHPNPKLKLCGCSCIKLCAKCKCGRCQLSVLRVRLYGPPSSELRHNGNCQSRVPSNDRRLP